MTRKPGRPDDLPEDDAGEVREEDGLLVDAYTSEAFEDRDAIDVMDVPQALDDEDVLDEVVDDGDGIESISLADVRMDDEADMGLGAEPRTPEELERAAIGTALRGRAAVTRDGEVHGERLFDQPG
jgi:hypothetical protein